MERLSPPVPMGSHVLTNCAAFEGARVAFLYAFDFLERDGDDLREQPLLARRKALAGLLQLRQEGIVFNEHTEEEGAVVFDHACSSAPRASCRNGSTRPIGL
jgi:ATP-dependent DNA ligase